MSNEIKLVTNKNTYLSELVNKYPENRDILAECIAQRNEVMEHKIADGQEAILDQRSNMFNLKGSNSANDIRQVFFWIIVVCQP